MQKNLQRPFIHMIVFSNDKKYIILKFICV